MTKMQTLFHKMSLIELRKYIDGCHAAREYDAYFEAASAEYNSRISKATQPYRGFKL